ncbi:MAG: 2Fe-2S iron-sulfur cluster-binding protein [Gemmataceae bacterium]
MSGVNPYIQAAKVKLPTRKYRVTFLPLNVVAEVDPSRSRPGHNGEPFSILDIAEGVGVELDHSCGGVCACSTCHVYVREGLKSCNEATDDELDMLDNARGLEVDASRLGCQCVPDGSCDIVVEIPAWNRNLARE